MKKQLIWVFELRKSVHYWWSCIWFAPECKELTCMLDPLIYRWGVPPVVIRCVHWTIQRGVLQTWLTALGPAVVMLLKIAGLSGILNEKTAVTNAPILQLPLIPMGQFSIKTLFYQCKDSHYKHEMVLLYERNSHTRNTIKIASWQILTHIKGILPKGPYLPCVSMAGRALLAGYHRHVESSTAMLHENLSGNI